jgi:hypothetical protein
MVFLLILIQFVFPNFLKLASFYNDHVFRPFQRLRNSLFGALPFSLGDFLYLFGGLVVVAVAVRWGRYLFRFRQFKHELAHSLMSSFISLATIYVLFFIGWGGNYYKPALSKFWNLSPVDASIPDGIRSYDSFLVGRLNTLEPYYRETGFAAVNDSAESYYKLRVDSRTRLPGLRVKRSLYGYFMQYFGIQGYYNPFTGEAQVNGALPEFMLPFVVCHEMAHQSGIAAEDDANLLAYAICTSAPDSSFAYSGYFNLWLYTQSKLRQQDTVQAAAMLERLNPESRAQVDTLRAIRRRYRSPISEYSGVLYDGYLRMHNQKDGIKSYNNVVLSAWAWEQRRLQGGCMQIVIY